MDDIDSLFRIFNSENRGLREYPFYFSLDTKLENFQPCLVHIIKDISVNYICLDMKYVIWEKYLYFINPLSSLKIFSKMYGGFLTPNISRGYVEYRFVLHINPRTEATISIESNNDIMEYWKDELVDLIEEVQIPRMYSYRKIGELTKAAK